MTIERSVSLVQQAWKINGEAESFCLVTTMGLCWRFPDGKPEAAPRGLWDPNEKDKRLEKLRGVICRPPDFIP
jgi:hypothetical protein